MAQASTTLTVLHVQLLRTAWRYGRGSTLTVLLWALFALVAGPAATAAQTADTTSTRPVEPLFAERDAWIAGGFLLGTAVLAPLDIAVAGAIQDSVVQTGKVLRGGAGVFRVLGFPGVVLVTGAMYGGGLLANAPELADIGLHATEAILIAEAVTVTGKAIFGRARPKLNTDDPFNLGLFRGFTHDDYQSFPSGHSTAAFATAAALTTEISRHRPEAKWWVGTLLFSGASLVAVSRLYHNEHWASDVMMGAAIGSFGGWKVVRYMHTHPDNRLNRWLLPRGALPTSSGGVALMWSVPMSH
jgi:membrane-associated phospholipid phosphatase